MGTESSVNLEIATPSQGKSNKAVKSMATKLSFRTDRVPIRLIKDS